MKTKNKPMKAHIKKLFLLPALIAGLGLILTGRVSAQNFKNLHSFTNSPDGANPVAGLILSGNTLYGTTQHGASSGNGTVFAVNTDGTGFTNLYGFRAMVNSFEIGIYGNRSEEHTSELQSPCNLVCRLLLEK